MLSCKKSLLLFKLQTTVLQLFLETIKGKYAVFQQLNFDLAPDTIKKHFNIPNDWSSHRALSSKSVLLMIHTIHNSSLSFSLITQVNLSRTFSFRLTIPVPCNKVVIFVEKSLRSHSFVCWLWIRIDRYRILKKSAIRNIW